MIMGEILKTIASKVAATACLVWQDLISSVACSLTNELNHKVHLTSNTFAIKKMEFFVKPTTHSTSSLSLP
jgi:hypothetical protein